MPEPETGTCRISRSSFSHLQSHLNTSSFASLIWPSVSITSIPITNNITSEIHSRWVTLTTTPSTTPPAPSGEPHGPSWSRTPKKSWTTPACLSAAPTSTSPARPSSTYTREFSLTGLETTGTNLSAWTGTGARSLRSSRPLINRTMRWWRVSCSGRLCWLRTVLA